MSFTLRFPKTANPDVLAGVTSACVIIPSAMAFAALAGAPVQAGLYSALAGLTVYAFLGTSPVLSVSVTAMSAILTAEAISKAYGDPSAAQAATAASTIALMVGALLLAAGAMRLGFLSNFISRPVLIGFKAGMGLWIASTQLGKVTGIPLDPSTFFSNVDYFLSHLTDANLLTMLFSAASVAALVAAGRRALKVPAPLLLVTIGIIAAGVFGLSNHGLALVGKIPAGLAGTGLPSLSQADLLLPGALAVALMISIESTSAARSFALPAGPHPEANRDCLAIGAGNVAAAFLGGIPSGGGTSQTAVNVEAGARTQLSQLIAAGAVLLSVTLLPWLFSEVPQASLGLIVIVAAAGLVNVEDFRRVADVQERDFLLAAAGFTAVIFLGPLAGILVAAGLSMLVLMYQVNHPPVFAVAPPSQRSNGPEAQAVYDDILILRIEGGVYFANAERIADAVQKHAAEAPETLRVVMIEASAMPDLEFTALEILSNLARDLHARGVELWLVSLNAGPREMLARYASEAGTPIAVYASAGDGLRAYRRLRAHLVPRPQKIA